jgi:hypothetical protein
VSQDAYSRDAYREIKPVTLKANPEFDDGIFANMFRDFCELQILSEFDQVHFHSALKTEHDTFRRNIRCLLPMVGRDDPRAKGQVYLRTPARGKVLLVDLPQCHQCRSMECIVKEMAVTEGARLAKKAASQKTNPKNI